MMLEVCIKRRDQADTALDDVKGTKGARDTNEVGLNQAEHGLPDAKEIGIEAGP